MPMHRRNKASRDVGRRGECSWFKNWRRRQRRRDALSRAMRQIQRRIRKGKR